MRALRIAATTLAVAAGLSACTGHVSLSGPRPTVRAVPGTPYPVASTPAADERAAQPTAPVPAAARVRPAPNACARNRAPQKIIVSIAQQHMWLCARNRLVRSDPVTTGMSHPGTRTPTGNFRVQYRVRNTTLTLNTGATYAVKYWIPFQGPLYGFHDSPWQKFPYGSPKYKTSGSHGCVHVPLRALAFLYRWTARPTKVHIS